MCCCGKALHPIYFLGNVWCWLSLSASCIVVSSNHTAHVLTQNLSMHHVPLPLFVRFLYLSFLETLFADLYFRMLCVKIMLIIFTSMGIKFWLDVVCVPPPLGLLASACGNEVPLDDFLCEHGGGGFTLWTQPENRLRLKGEWLELSFRLDYLLESLLLLIICLKNFICTSRAMSLASFTNMNADIRHTLSSPRGRLPVSVFYLLPRKRISISRGLDIAYIMW